MRVISAPREWCALRRRPDDGPGSAAGAQPHLVAERGTPSWLTARFFPAPLAAYSA